MKYKQLTLICTLLLFTLTCFGQLEKTIHQTFELNDKSTVQFDLYGTYTLVPWAGNNILVETKIQLFNSSASILKHFVEKDQRYLIEEDTTNNGILRLFSHDMKRATLRSKSGVTSTEEIETKIYIPEKYVIKDEKTIVLDEPKN